MTSAFSKVVIPDADRENEISRAAGIGVMLHAHGEETFEVESDTEEADAQIGAAAWSLRRRASQSWRFAVLGHEALPVDDVPDETMPEVSVP